MARISEEWVICPSLPRIGRSTMSGLSHCWCNLGQLVKVVSPRFLHYIVFSPFTSHYLVGIMSGFCFSSHFHSLILIAILVCKSFYSGVCHVVMFELYHPFHIYYLTFYFCMKELFLPLHIGWIFNFTSIWSHGCFFKSVSLSLILVRKLSQCSRGGPCFFFICLPSLFEHSCFLAHDVPGSSCTFSVPVLESAICPRSLCPFGGGWHFKTKIL